MYHIEMASHMYDIWSLIYRSPSLVFVRHRFDLLCGLLSYNDPSYVFCIIILYSLPIQEQRLTIGPTSSNR